MAKFHLLIFALVLVLLATAQAVPQRKRTSSRLISRPRTRVLARQEFAGGEAEAEAEADAVTPYPSADELKPEIPFNETPDVFAEFPPLSQQPDEVYGPPDQTDSHIPDEVYGPPEFWLPGEEPASTFEEQQARLVAVRRSAALRQKQQRLAYRKAAAYRKGAKRSFARPARFIAIRGRRFA